MASTRSSHAPDIDAVDFNRANDAGADVLAGANGGTVTAATADGSYGNYVQVSYSGGVELLFAHLARIDVSESDAPGSVMAQTRIGTVGSTGTVSGAHLHYEQRLGGVPRPPVIEGKRWNVGVEIGDDRGDLSKHPGVANVSRNCGSIAAEPVVDSPGVIAQLDSILSGGPANDDWENATRIGSLPFSDWGDNEGASRRLESGEHSHTAYGV